MSEKLRRYLLNKIINEFVFFFSILYIISLIVSFLRYTEVKIFKLYLLFSLYILPFTMHFSFFTACFFAFREIKEKILYLTTFNLSFWKFNRFVLLLSVLFFSLSLFLSFALSPKAFFLVQENLLSSIKVQRKDQKDFLHWGKNIVYAEKINLNKNFIAAQDGFIFDGEKILKFQKIKIYIKSPESRFSKDIAELIIDEGEKGKKEIIYAFSTFFSQVSCSSFVFAYPYIYILCNPSMVLISKFFRDSLEVHKFLIVSFTLHSIVLLGSFFMAIRKF